MCTCNHFDDASKCRNAWYGWCSCSCHRQNQEREERRAEKVKQVIEDFYKIENPTQADASKVLAACLE